MYLGILRIIFYALLAYVIYWIIRFFSSLNKGLKSPPSPQKLSGKMVKDEICDTYLPKEDAKKEIIQGEEYYFCSDACRQKFLESKK
jgi:YHS domain-containing protein